MNAEFFDAVADIEKEKGIPREYMYEKIRQAMLTAFRKDTPDCEDNVEVILDEAKKKIEMVVKKTVVARVIDPYVEISEEAAHRISKRAKIGDVVSVPVETKQFGRIAAQAAKQVIIQGIREAERGMIYEEFNSKEHEILTGVVNKIDPRTGCAFLKISSNSDYTEAMLAPAECIRGEVLHEGDRIKVYVVEVRNSTRGPQVLISRTHPGLVKRLFELEVPEIFDGTVEIKSIAREAGSRTKLAVYASQDGIDPVGACVGMKGSRIHGIVRELRNENIDVINYTSNISLFIQRALSPAKISSIRVNEEEHKAEVYLRPEEVSLAIGKGGLNIKLACMLTEYAIDVFRDVEGADEEDIYLDEFSDEIDSWVIEALKNIGCYTAKSVLAMNREEIVERADLEEQTVDEVLAILSAEFEEEEGEPQE